MLSRSQSLSRRRMAQARLADLLMYVYSLRDSTVEATQCVTLHAIELFDVLSDALSSAHECRSTARPPA